jgi:hypothetical protein
MELLVESGAIRTNRLKALMQEADELIAIFVAALKTTRSLRAA